MVESEGANYYLNMNSKKIHLNNTYMKAIPEAIGIVRSELGLILPQEDIEITAKGGSLCFYGDWFGRPYDNYHQIIHTPYGTRQRNIITYTWEGDALIKTSKYGIQHLKTKEPHVAVYMA